MSKKDQDKNEDEVLWPFPGRAGAFMSRPPVNPLADKLGRLGAHRAGHGNFFTAPARSKPFDPSLFGAEDFLRRAAGGHAAGGGHARGPGGGSVSGGSGGSGGWTHPLTLRALGDLARAQLAQGRPEEAASLLRTATAGIAAQLGPRHPETLASAALLACAAEAHLTILLRAHLGDVTGGQRVGAAAQKAAAQRLEEDCASGQDEKEQKRHEQGQEHDQLDPAGGFSASTDAGASQPGKASLAGVAGFTAAAAAVVASLPSPRLVQVHGDAAECRPRGFPEPRLEEEEEEEEEEQQQQQQQQQQQPTSTLSKPPPCGPALALAEEACGLRRVVAEALAEQLGPTRRGDVRAAEVALAEALERLAALGAAAAVAVSEDGALDGPRVGSCEGGFVGSDRGEQGMTKSWGGGGGGDGMGAGPPPDRASWQGDDAGASWGPQAAATLAALIHPPAVAHTSTAGGYSHNAIGASGRLRSNPFAAAPLGPAPLLRAQSQQQPHRHQPDHSRELHARHQRNGGERWAALRSEAAALRVASATATEAARHSSCGGIVSGGGGGALLRSEFPGVPVLPRSVLVPVYGLVGKGKGQPPVPELSSERGDFAGGKPGIFT